MAALNNYNDRFDDITYDNGWQNVSTPETYVPPERLDTEKTTDRKREKKDKKKSEPKQKKPFKFLLLTVQLALCILVLAAALIFKQFGGKNYENIKAIYFENLNNSLFETPPENILDLSEIFRQGISDNNSGSTDAQTSESGESAAESDSQAENDAV